MNIKKVVEELTARGYTVKVYHHRATVPGVQEAEAARESGDKLAVPPVAPKHLLAGQEISPYGGKTIAVIVREGIPEVRGVALCSPLDQFNRRTGTSKALGRAISVLRLTDPEAGGINTGKKN